MSYIFALVVWAFPPTVMSQSKSSSSFEKENVQNSSQRFMKLIPKDKAPSYWNMEQLITGTSTESQSQ